MVSVFFHDFVTCAELVGIDLLFDIFFAGHTKDILHSDSILSLCGITIMLNSLFGLLLGIKRWAFYRTT